MAIGGLKDGGQYYNVNESPIKLETKPGKITIVDPDVPGKREYSAWKRQCNFITGVYLNLDANVGRSTLKFDTIQFIFNHAHQLLTRKITNSSKTESILSSIVKIEHHHHLDTRRQGVKFKAQQTWIENGSPEGKKGFARNRFGGKIRNGGGIMSPYEKDHARSHHHRHDDNNDNSRNSSRGSTYKGGYKRDNISEYNSDTSRFQNSYHRHNQQQNSYKAEPYSKRFKDNNQYENSYEKEYQRHKKNNNSHLAQHYKKKSENYKRR
jgi:hypothetical protein